MSVLEESKQTEYNSLKTQYSLIFFIHGDSDYIYLDTSDNEYKADEETVMNAEKIAEQNPTAEVFIFHQKPRGHFLFFFPLKDGEFYYYRNGNLIANESYWRDQEKSNLDFEAEIYHLYHVANQNKFIKMFLYFGHEIPEFGGEGYDESYPDRSFTIDDLASGMKSFTSDSIKFDLTVLSTCYGGTPNTIGKLVPFAQTIIASPENLHLSYFDISALEQLDVNLKDGDVPAFAKRFARQSFDKLAGSIETTVSVVVYDIKQVQNYLNSVQKDYDLILDSLKRLTQADQEALEHCDCADIPAYQISTINNGVEILYRPARFGRSKNKQSHSGWECWKN
ncbi:MAG: hypothetical protein IPH11_15170 [Ignavibacteriales bacterium]|nr:hypothetical protein [Ignavibacteriales bacterium]